MMSDSERYEEFVRLLRLHTSQVFAYINALLLNWNDAEDLFQETCLVLWQKFDGFEPGTSFAAWAMRIAEHKVMNFQTTQSRRVAFAEKLRLEIQDDLSCQDADDASADLAALLRCMEKLTPTERRTVSLCYGESLPVRRVAAGMGRPPESVYRSLRRIRGLLLECIQRDLRQPSISTNSCQNAPRAEERT